MNRLVVVSLEKGNIDRLVKFPLRLLDPQESEMVSWISEYNQKYGSPPSLERLQEEFDDFIPIELRGDEIIDDEADKAIERKRLSFFIAEMGKVIDEARIEHDVDEQKVYAVMKTVAQTEDDDIAYSTYDRAKYRKRSQTSAVPFFAGILNKAMGDLHAGDYCLVIARLGTGKSLITQWQSREWLLSGLKTLFISQEMLANEIFSRIDGMVASFNPLVLRQEITEEVDVRLKVAQMTATHSGGEIYAPKGLKTPEQISMAAKFLGVDVVVVDGVYQLAPDLMHAPSARWERITEVSGQLKQMAQAVKRPLLATTQIKRTGRSESFTSEDIAFADALGQDADQIISLEPDPVDPTNLKASLIKNRYGPPMSALIALDFETMRIKEIR